jgi:uncharacterized protein
MRTFCIALVLLSLALAGCGGGSSDTGGGSTGSKVTTTASELRTVTIESSGGKEVEVRVEVADTEAEHQLGFMGRTALPEDRGMLFVFDEEQELTFWMKDTLIPLSVAFMDSEGRIVDIQDMKPLDDDPPHYVSAEPAQYALEVNKGFFEERGIKAGDRAELPV